MSTYPTARHRVRKLSVSLPPDLAAFVENRARERGTAVSAELAEMVRHELEADQQRRLDAALTLDADENRRFARATSLAAREAIGESEW